MDPRMVQSEDVVVWWEGGEEDLRAQGRRNTWVGNCVQNGAQQNLLDVN